MRLAASASMVCWPSRNCTLALARAIAATSGLASSASMVSSPKMVDSAPELRFTVPFALIPSSVAPVAGL